MYYYVNIGWLKRKTKDEKLMLIPYYNKQNYFLSRLELLVEKIGHCQLEQTSQYSINSQRVREKVIIPVYRILNNICGSDNQKL